jgi:osmotically-inducible protein OsmY
MKTSTLCAAMLVTIPALAQTPDPKIAAEKVKEALRESDVPTSDIVVSTHAETVLVTGKADSKADAARALSTAEAAAGDVRVAGGIEVREAPAGSQQATDRMRTIEAALKQDDQTAQLGILLSVDANQVIGLHGLVPSPQSRAAAEKVAKRAAGTQPVRNYLKVPGE